MNPQLQIMLSQGIQAFQNGNFDGADSILKRIIQVDPKNLPALHVLGLIKASQKKYQEAVDLLARAARINPNDASIQYNLAKALIDCGSDRESIPHHKKAVELAPSNPDAWLNYGKTLSFAIRSYDEALVAFDNAISLEPNYAEAYLNKGATFKELKRFDEALIFAEKALSINPNLAEAWVNRGFALKELKLYQEVVSSFENALRLNPDIDWILGDLLHAKMKICSWLGFDDSLKKIIYTIEADGRAVTPFTLQALSDNPPLQKKSSEIYSRVKYSHKSALGEIPKGPKGEKIRVGYFSADFGAHAVSLLTAELFELHDKSRFETFAFSFGADDQSSMRARLNNAFNQFIDVSKSSDIAIAALARDLHIDIAVDLGGLTAASRPGIFANRAAPTQVSYIGYLGTMGAEYIDYLLADITTVPKDAEIFYTENIVRLPSYQVNDRKREISKRQFTRQDLGLPEKGFVFCCFNNNYKILPATFEVWMRILNAVNGSVLFLYADNPWAESNLKQEAERRGISSDRLVFSRRIPAEEYLARYRVCDLFLDTWPYNAGATASDALWVGVPVLTLIGKSFASRVAASLLNSINLSVLITKSQVEYESLAIELATNPEKLNDIRNQLLNNRLTTPLFDTPLFVKNLEIAYIKMYQNYQAGLVPKDIFLN
jgi:protein O-GlcNAc transferase